MILDFVLADVRREVAGLLVEIENVDLCKQKEERESEKGNTDNRE